jgi:hypothetical protein
VLFVVAEHPVRALGSGTTDEPFGKRVHPRRPWRSLDGGAIRSWSTSSEAVEIRLVQFTLSRVADEFWLDVGDYYKGVESADGFPTPARPT